jgi:two-component system, chemotaxis family, CheB/CheR fusion protein
VFDLFAQGPRVEGRSQAGLGIGLALVKRLVELHGGEVTAHSEGLGRGSEFTVRLPCCAPPTAVSAPAAPADLANCAPDRRRRILIADDNRDALDSLANLLQLAGHEVHKALDGEQALQSAAQLRPEILLLDIGMPGMDGYEVARRLRSQPWGSKLLLVALTGWGQDNDRRRSREAGFDSHWVKPLDLDKLSQLLETLSAASPSGGPAVQGGEVSAGAV